MSVRRLVLASVVSLGALAGGVLFSAPVALATTPPVVEEESVLDVAGTSATLQAKVNPEESETTYRFEYGTSEAYGSSVPVPDGLVGSGSAPVTVSAHAQGLAPATEYHYRVVALVDPRGETVDGADGTFITQPAGGELALSDGRQWELVSPPNKHGARLESLSENGPIQAAEGGGALTFGANVPTEAEPAGYGPPALLGDVQVRSVRGAQGWSARDIAIPHNSSPGAFDPDEYLLFSGDLSLGLTYPAGYDTQGEDPTLLSSEASEMTPYIRRESLCDAPASASECYLPLLTGKEGFADVPPGTVFGQGSYLETNGTLTERFGGASPDLHHVELLSRVALTATPTPEHVELYEWSMGAPASEALQLVSVLPAREGGHPTVGRFEGVSGGWGRANRNEISEDGRRIFWAVQPGEGERLPGEGEERRVYMRDTVRRETVRLDVQQPGVPSPGRAYADFQIASGDGSRVFLTDFDPQQRLTAQSGTHGQDLYECEIVEEAGGSQCRLTDLTPASEAGSAEMQGYVLGASEDGSYVYFVANGVLGDGAEHGAVQGTCGASPSGEAGGPTSALEWQYRTCNLYEYHDGAARYIATLSEADNNNWDGSDYLYRNVLRTVTARVSPNGRYLAFMSDRSLTGYDNRDAVSGLPDAEVYLYDSLSGRLSCVSCNPTGGRPTGVRADNFSAFGEEKRANIIDFGLPQGEGKSAAAETGVAANLPGGNTIGGGGFLNGELYQPRLLSDSGRLFFNSDDALGSQDVNGQEDVYEFESAGGGDCTASSVTFSARSGGCVGLVSSGSSPEESGFLDASAGGGDVFFLTSGRLTPQDYDTSYDVYDAHECSAATPCMAQPVSSPPCDSGDSCKAAPTPQPSIFGAPASATFSGPGNIVPSPPAPVVAGRSLRRAQKLARALRACRGKPRSRRRECKREAHRRYGGKAARAKAKAVRAGAGVSGKGRG